MILLTPRFGSVSFEPQEVIVFEHGLQGWQELRQWLLLADAEHERLLWLQSIRRPLVALPVISVHAGVAGSAPTALLAAAGRNRSRSATNRNVLLLRLCHEGNQLSADLQHPILIDVDRCRGVQARRRTRAVVAMGTVGAVDAVAKKRVVATGRE